MASLTLVGFEQLDALIEQAQQASTTGPLVNPTAWIGEFETHDLLLDALKAAQTFRDQMAALEARRKELAG